MTHGTVSGYRNHKCRCEECRRAVREKWVKVDRKALADLLHELCPDGLTDDCPARRARAAAA